MTAQILICYGTRYGSTAEVAEDLAKTAQDLGKQVEVVNLKKNNPQKSPHEYDLVVVGSGIQAGQWTKEPLKFIKNNLESLSQTKVALFVVCGYAASEDKCDTAQTDFLDKIAENHPGLNPVSTGLFGGVFDTKKYNFAVRALVKSMIKKELPPGEEVPEKLDQRDWNQIREWITKLVQ
ncbi:MAG: flavodoxin domain-containing protein [Candidatus Thorarchaeota archaeon]